MSFSGHLVSVDPIEDLALLYAKDPSVLEKVLKQAIREGLFNSIIEMLKVNKKFNINIEQLLIAVSARYDEFIKRETPDLVQDFSDLNFMMEYSSLVFEMESQKIVFNQRLNNLAKFKKNYANFIREVLALSSGECFSEKVVKDNKIIFLKDEMNIAGFNFDFKINGYDVLALAKNHQGGNEVKLQAKVEEKAQLVKSVSEKAETVKQIVEKTKPASVLEAPFILIPIPPEYYKLGYFGTGTSAPEGQNTPQRPNPSRSRGPNRF